MELMVIFFLLGFTVGIVLGVVLAKPHPRH